MCKIVGHESNVAAELIGVAQPQDSFGAMDGKGRLIRDGTVPVQGKGARNTAFCRQDCIDLAFIVINVFTAEFGAVRRSEHSAVR